MGLGVIDVHAHWIPDSALAAALEGRDWHGSEMSLAKDGCPRMVTAGKTSTVGSTRHYDGIEGRLEDMDRMGVDVQVLSVLPPFFRYGLPPALGVAGCHEINDNLRRFIDRVPGRFFGWGTLPLQAEPDEVLRELARCRTELEFVGIEIGTHVQGTQLADPGFHYLWEALAGSGTAIFLHPPAGDRRALDLPGGFFLDNVIGNPTETTIAVTGLVLAGIFERFPGLRLVAAHGGGYFPAAAGRINHAVRVRRETGRLLEDRDHWLPPGLFVDTLTHSPAALRFLVDQLGIDRVMIGTDYPSDMGENDPVGFVRGGLGRDRGVDLAAVLGGNAERVLLGPAAVGVATDLAPTATEGEVHR